MNAVAHADSPICYLFSHAVTRSHHFIKTAGETDRSNKLTKLSVTNPARHSSPTSRQVPYEVEIVVMDLAYQKNINIFCKISDAGIINELTDVRRDIRILNTDFHWELL